MGREILWLLRCLRARGCHPRARMKPPRHILALLVSLFIAAGTIRADTFRPFNASNPTNPYALDDIDGFDLGDYAYCRWGVLQSQDYVSIGEADLSFTPLTRGPFTFAANPDLFLSSSLTTLTDWNLLQFSSGTWTPPSGDDDGSVSFSALSGKTYSLFRKLHFRDYLQAKFLSDPLPANAKKVIVLIHGWNPESGDYSYLHEFDELYEAINAKISGSDWHIVFYHWEEDADTGPARAINFHVGGDTFFGPDATSASEAGSIGHLHGQHLGQLLASFSQLEKVHLIAHSAGTWVARSATRHLLDRTNQKVQVTLLDPFIPGQLRKDDGSANGTPLTKALIDALPSMDPGETGQLHSLENIFAEDLDAGGQLFGWDVPVNSDWAYRATSQLFSWNGRIGINQRVDWTPGIFLPIAKAAFYDDHFGPIQFYADSVRATGYSPAVVAGLQNPLFNLSLVGWKRSMFYNEPVVFPRNPTVTEVTGGGKTLSGNARRRGASAATTGIQYRWEVSTTSASSGFSPFRAIFGSSPVLNLTSADASAGRRWFRIVAKTDAGFDTGNAVQIGSDAQPPDVEPPPSAPAAPENLVASAVSASQINLKWVDKSNNETGFRLQRRTGSGAFSDIPTTAAQNGQTFSNISGLSPGTTYFYRVRAFNNSGDSAWSNEAAAKTLAIAGTTYTLQVDAVDPSANATLAVSIGSWTGSGDNYQTQTTGFPGSFTGGTRVTVIAPATLPGGRTFQYWSLDSATRFYTTTAWVDMDGGHAFIAIYGTGTPPTRTLTSLAIEGPSSVDENGSASYKARATFSDGSSAIVSGVHWGEDTDYLDFSSTGVLDAESVSSDKTVEIRADYIAGGITKRATKNITVRNVVSTQTYTLTRNVVGSGEVGHSPSGSRYTAGTVVSLHANTDGGYLFSHWTGDVSPGDTDDDITVRMDRNRTVTAHFVADTSEGGLQVNLLPPQAAAEGAQWKYRNYTAWRESGNTQNFIPVGSGYIHFKDIPGWITPDEVQRTIIGGQTIPVTATYREIKGAVQVTISPPQAGQAGARWRINGGAPQESSVTVADAPTGTNTIEFLGIPGWSTPPSQTVSVERGVTAIRTGEYAPPAGFPIITSVAPRTGPIEGGTTVTFEGANFQPGATVTFGGVPATTVTVVSPSRITAVTPPRASYGTVPLALTSGGQTITQSNGFSYLNPLGSNIELVAQFGGNVEAVAVVGSLCYYGEGTSLVIADFTNSATPVERGRIALPAFIRGIAVAGNIAYVADAFAGLIAVDITAPTAPSIVGFFDTEFAAQCVAIDGSVAYVTDGDSGLLILDVASPTAIARLGAVDTAGYAKQVAVGTIGADKYAFVAENNLAIRVIRVTNPSTPVEIANIPAESGAGFRDVKLVGTTLYVSDWQSGVKIFNASNPASLIQTGAFTGAAAGSSHDVIGNRIYTCGSGMKIADLAITPNPAQLGYFEVEGSVCHDLTVSNNLAFAAMGQSGLQVISVSSPASMNLRSAIQPITGAEDIVVTGNTAFVGAGGLQVFSIANPANPVRIGSWTGGEVSDLVVANNKATVVRYGQDIARVLDVSNPTTPTLLGSYTAVEAWGIGILGDSPLVVGRTKGATQLPLLDVLNLASPSSPQRSGVVTLDAVDNSPGDSITTAGSWAFVGRSGKALDIVSLSNPNSPQMVASVGIAANFLDVAATEDGNFVYVPTGPDIRVVDVTAKATPAILPPNVTSPFAGTSFLSVRVAGMFLFAGSTLQLHVYDISNPASPQLVAFYDTPGYGYGIEVVSDIIYVADGHAGVSILRLKDVDKPTVTITSPTSNAAFPTTSALLTLGGTATDLQGVVRVTWENDRGGGGVALGTNSWTIPNLQLAAGVNVLTVTAEDAQGNLARDSITVTATLPDTDAPAILITGPKPPPAFTFTAATLPLTGTAADFTGVQSVAWVNDRGGSGMATGTGVWNADIPLFEGPNRIALTARDTVGNESQTELLVTYLPPDTTAPRVGITFPTDAQEAATTQAQVNLSGEADDDRAVTRVSWANSRGGSGEATGTRAWHANGIVLQPGVNVLTLTAEDAAGNTGTDTLAVTFTPAGSDPARPVLTVQTPGTKPLVVMQNPIACAGQASGGSAIVEVAVQVNDGPWLGATDTGNWTADVMLAAGQNVIRFKAIDATGRESLSVEREVIYRQFAPLALGTLGEGTETLVGNPAVAALEVGKLYTADAKPAKGWIFAGWEGVVVSNSKRVSFVMEEGAALRAVFVENPYDELASVYRGLIRAEPLAHATSGAATVALTKSGAFTAQIVIGGKKLALKGVFDGTGSFLGKIKASRTQTFDVLLALDTSSPDAPVTGLLSDGTTTMALNAWPVTKFDRKLGTPLAGGYTVAIEPGSTAGTPLGFGTGRMTVAKAGGVTFALRLANGTRLALASAITAGDRVPVYAAMDTARSSFSAPLAFADKPDSDLDGIALWSSARVRAKTYPFDPFAFEPRLLAQRYTSPAKDERALRALDATNGAATLTFDDGTTSLTQAFTLGTDNKPMHGSPLLNGFKMTLTPAKGEFTGSLLLPANGKRVPFNGVLLEKSGESVGLLLSPDAEMAITLEPAGP